MAVIDMASHSNNGPVSLQTIAVRQNIPLNYLEQIFSKLRKEGIVASMRGPGGGYIPGRSISQINLAEVILAADGSFKMTRCAPDFKCNPEGGKCNAHGLWKGAGQAMFNYFSSIFLSDIVSGKIKVEESVK